MPDAQAPRSTPDLLVPDWVREYLLSHGPEGLACVDGDGAVHGWNPMLAELLGQRDPNWLLHPIEDLLGRANEDDLLRKMLAEASGAGIARGEGFVAIEGIDTWPAEFTVVRVTQPHDPGCFFVYIRDDTERSKLSRDVMDLEVQQRVLMNRAGGLVLVVDAFSGEILHLNEQAEDYLRATTTQLRGRNVREVLDEVEAFTAEGDTGVFLQNKEKDVELTIPSPAGFSWLLQMSCNKVNFQGRPALQWVGRELSGSPGQAALVADGAGNQLPISEITAAAEALRHPASQIELVARYCLNHPDLPWRDRRDRLEQIQELGDRIRNVSEDLLYLTRITAGTLDARRTETTVGKILASVLPRLQRRAMSQGTEILTVHVEEEATLFTDPRLLIHAFRRFLDRALDTGCKAITITANRDGDCIRFVLIDTGEALPEGAVKRVLSADTLATLNTEDPSGLADLPLVLAVHLLRAIGGHVEVQSSPGMGTRVGVTLLA